ncbi:MAG: hypothetical protein KDD42_09265 [Bdellovibrionales bacterium]|nr:hypothetical protein [Bdellovibrionales bacterium]
MSAFSQIATVTPEHLVDVDKIKKVSLDWLRDDRTAQEKFLRISTHSGVKTRKFVLPYEDILSLNGMEHRANQFEEEGTNLLVQAINNTLSENAQDASEIGAIIFTSCSVPSIPCIDARAILETKLPNNIARIPIYQHGCAGGVIGLALGSKLATLGKPVIVSSVELCSLVFQPNNHEGTQLVGAAIFADGAAATVIYPERGALRIKDVESSLIPESRHLMGYDIFDDGFHLRLDRALPNTLVEHAPKIIEEFLKRNGKALDEIKYWLFHPGGIKILRFLEETFRLDKEQCVWSYDVLRDYGNLSSATILFVIDAFLKDRQLMPGENAIVMGIGPGLTVELILLEG